MKRPSTISSLILLLRALLTTSVRSQAEEMPGLEFGSVYCPSMSDAISTCKPGTLTAPFPMTFKNMMATIYSWHRSKYFKREASNHEALFLRHNASTTSYTAHCPHLEFD